VQRGEVLYDVNAGDVLSLIDDEVVLLVGRLEEYLT
jgi:hypothetical protein